MSTVLVPASPIENSAAVGDVNNNYPTSLTNNMTNEHILTYQMYVTALSQNLCGAEASSGEPCHITQNLWSYSQSVTSPYTQQWIKTTTPCVVLSNTFVAHLVGETPVAR